MSTADLLAGTVMNSAAALMNDPARRVYGYTTQNPYINMAMQELQELFALNDLPVTEKISTIITLNAGVDTLGYITTPALPIDFIEPETIWESTSGLNQWTPVNRKL